MFRTASRSTLPPTVKLDPLPNAPDTSSFESFAHRTALALGAGAVGIARLTEAEIARDGQRLQRWLDEGHGGTMAYLSRQPERRSDPRQSLPGALTVLVAAFDYGDANADAAVERRRRRSRSGRIARYARGRDYHGFLLRRMRKLLRVLQERDPELRGRAYVDTGPILERAWAARAGIGWIGKHSLTLRQDGGSWSLLGVLLLNRALSPSPPSAPRCGTCTRCLDVCPTGAIVAPYVVDARRCISYLTIELRGAIPRPLRESVGEHLFGCDLCQEVCPWNRFAAAPKLAEFAPHEELAEWPPERWLELTPEAFRDRFRGTPLARPAREGMLRNACVVLGNQRRPETAEALSRVLRQEASPVLRGHAAWALGRLRTPEAEAALLERMEDEEDASVREELAEALAESRGIA
jgi:epoxyqueuosine reductase